MTKIGIKYYESKMNLNWKPILKTILDDPEDFIANGGWDFLNLEQTDSDDEAEEESDGAAGMGAGWFCVVWGLYLRAVCVFFAGVSSILRRVDQWR